MPMPNRTPAKPTVAAKSSQLPVSLSGQGKRDMRAQFAALCFRKAKSGPKILMISSRDTGRWVLPKGWPLDGKTPAECAAIEAWEEAGVVGPISDGCEGVYSYVKDLDTGVGLPILVAVFALRVQELQKEYPEADQRQRKWFSPKKAARNVAEPELAQLLIRFNPA